MKGIYFNKWAVLAVVTLVSFVTNVDATIVVIGLPSLINDLHIELVTGMWVITSYLITSTILLLPAGRWADIKGTKRIFLWGFFIFTIATVLCGASTSGAMLIIFRLIQGIGAAFALATATPILMRTFPKEQLGLAIGINSTSWVIGSIIGPVAGGALINSFGWRSMFFVSAPFGLLALIGGWVVLKEWKAQQSGKTDWIGVFTFGLTLTALLLALSQGQSWGWSSLRTIGLFLTAIVLGCVFIMAELKVRDPLFNLSLFTHRLYSTGLGITMSYCIGYFSITLLLALYLQGAQGLSPLETGLLLVPLSLPQLIMGPLGGKLADSFGAIRVLMVGMILIAFSLLLLGNLGNHLSAVKVIIPLLIISIANGFAWPSLAKTVLSSAPSKHAGAASGMFYTVYNIGRVGSQTVTLLLLHLVVSPAVASQAFLGTHINGDTTKDSLVHVTDIGFRVYTLFFIAALLLTIGMLRNQKQKLVFKKVDEHTS
ncbi:MFS transporter [Falsibacillus pallidus]|uniref:EmrB/QacA subfamily drug resistance transporter n=1 Tax=Falsibacillus pallidus TaxID=493781 RepID=A0A370GCY3_9BACI|nr:MFS transporter [Falsibacillus pallidus]RDI40929.1 EmrB/QacA subfamily drug resistance transporter [Falsibacillus pallidus]